MFSINFIVNFFFQICYFRALIELYYFNSSSGKFLFDFFDELEEAACQGKTINIYWCYREADKSIKEAGEDFKEDFEEATYKLKII